MSDIGSASDPLSRRAFGMAIHSFATTVGVSLLSLIITTFLARWLGPSELGAFELTYATGSLAALVLAFSVPSVVTYAIARRLLSTGKVLRVALAVSSLVALGTSLIGLALTNSPVASAFLPPDAGARLVWLLGGWVGLTVLGQIGRAILIGQGRIETANLRELTTRFLQLITLVAASFLFATNRSFPPYQLALATVALSAGAGAVLYVAAAQVPEGERGVACDAPWTGLLRYAAPGHISNVLQHLNYRADIFLVGYYVGAAGVGLYTLAATLGQLLWLVSTPLAGVLFPVVAGSPPESHESAALAARMCRIAVALSCLGGALLAVAGDWMVRLWFGAAFAPAASALLWLLPGIVLFNIANVLGAYFSGTGRPGANLRVAAVGLAVTAPAALVLVPRFGIHGAAAASTLSYTVGTAAMLHLFTRHARLDWNACLIPTRSDYHWVRRALTRGA